MAILVNMGQRGFVLKEGFLAPGAQIEVSAETAEKLSKMYGKELKVIVTEKVEVAEPVKEELKDEKPVKRGRPKKVQETK